MCCRSRYSARFPQSNPHRLSWIHPPLLSVCPCISDPSSSQIVLRGQPPTSARTPRNHLQSAFNSNRPLTGDATSGRIRALCVAANYVKLLCRRQTWTALRPGGSSNSFRTSRNPCTAPATQEREVVRSVRRRTSSCPRGPRRSLCWFRRRPSDLIAISCSGSHLP